VNVFLGLVPGTLAGILAIILLLADGFIFGLAAKKALTSIVLIIVGLILAGFVGVVVPFLTTNNVLSHLSNVFASLAIHIGPLVYSFPVFWIIGFALGLWKG
jgi:hypothetical protein